MVLMYIHDSFEGRTPDFDLDRIRKIIETKSDGTFPEKVLNLNRVSEVASAIPSIEFEVELKSHSLDELIIEVNDKQPPIAWVQLSEEGNIHKCAHAVVITEIDKDGNRIYYNDPIFGEKSEDLTSFITRWDEEDRVLVKVKIGKKKQRMLEEFGQNKELPKNEEV